MSADRSMSTLGLELEAALRDLGSALAAPDATGLAERVRARIEADQPRRVGRWSWPWPRPLRRSVVLALVALLVAAAVVTAAIGYGLPGIRILFGPPPSNVPSPSVPASAAPGAGLGLGVSMSLDEARAAVEFEIALPAVDGVGPPDAVFVSDGRVALAWATNAALPGTAQEGLGLLIVELRGSVVEKSIEKLLVGGTHVERVTVGNDRGYWIEGERHFIAYTAPDGTRIDDTLRQVGNTLVWTTGGITYRLEGELTRDEAIALGETLR